MCDLSFVWTFYFMWIQLFLTPEWQSVSRGAMCVIENKNVKWQISSYLCTLLSLSCKMWFSKQHRSQSDDGIHGIEHSQTKSINVKLSSLLYFCKLMCTKHCCQDICLQLWRIFVNHTSCHNCENWTNRSKKFELKMWPTELNLEFWREVVNYVIIHQNKWIWRQDLHPKH